MDQIHVTLPDGSVKEFPKGTTPVEIAKSISPRLADAALVATEQVLTRGELDLTLAVTVACRAVQAAHDVGSAAQAAARSC